MAKAKYIAWMNGCSVKHGTMEEVEQAAWDIYKSQAWRDRHQAKGKASILRITTYGSQRLISECVMECVAQDCE